MLLSFDIPDKIIQELTLIATLNGFKNPKDMVMAYLTAEIKSYRTKQAMNTMPQISIQDVVIG